MRLNRATLKMLSVPAGKSELLVFDSDLPGFGLRLRAGGKASWVAQYRVGSKQRRVTLGSTASVDPEEARKRAREALARVSLGEDPQAAKVEARKAVVTTLATVRPAYLTFAAARQRPSHHGDVVRYMTKSWATFDALALADINRARVAARLLELSRKGGPFAATRARATLSAFFSWAIGEGLADANPTVGTNRPAIEKARDRVLSDEELALAWRCAGTGEFGAIVRLLVLTGARREEIAGMAWSELTGATWRLPAARAKNHREHVLDLPPAALTVLDAIPRRAGRDLIFGTGRGGFAGFSKAKADLDAKMLAARGETQGADSVIPPWRLHDLRRTAATGLADLGMQPHVVEAVLNHVSGSKAGVAGIYNRASYSAEKRTALAIWADHVQSLTA